MAAAQEREGGDFRASLCDVARCLGRKVIAMKGRGPTNGTDDDQLASLSGANNVRDR